MSTTNNKNINCATAPVIGSARDMFDNFPEVGMGNYDFKKDSSQFQGTPGNWKEDIGIDEIDNDLFRIIVSSPDGKTVAHAFGSTPEEVEANAKAIAKAPNMHKALKVAALKLVEIDNSPRKSWKKTARYIELRLSELVYAVTK